jgi:mono/diheme cytochrome c family protein
MKSVWTIALSGLAVGAVALAAVFMFLAPFGGSPDPATTAARIARGEVIYADYCAACHGANLEGAPDWRRRDAEGYLPAPPHDETGHTWHHPDRQLFEITKYGTEALVGGDYKSTMIGFGDQLSDEEIRAVLAFIKSRWPEKLRNRQADVTERAEAGD